MDEAGANEETQWFYSLIKYLSETKFANIREIIQYESRRKDH